MEKFENAHKTSAKEVENNDDIQEDMGQDMNKTRDYDLEGISDVVKNIIDNDEDVLKKDIDEFKRLFRLLNAKIKVRQEEIWIEKPPTGIKEVNAHLQWVLDERVKNPDIEQSVEEPPQPVWTVRSDFYEIGDVIYAKPNNLGRHRDTSPVAIHYSVDKKNLCPRGKATYIYEIEGVDLKKDTVTDKELGWKATSSSLIVTKRIEATPENMEKHGFAFTKNYSSS